MSKLKVLDLFSGIGGFSLGLERTGGFETVAFCEIDPFCRRVLAKHWPDVPCFEDVTTLRGESVGPVDVICGGFPCQDISLAGRGEGLEGQRSGLWAQIARLVREIRPRFLLVENVSALLGRGMDRVLGDLAESGYDAEWECLAAYNVGAPHIRDRVWIVAYPRSEQHEGASSEIGWASTQGLPSTDTRVGRYWLSSRKVRAGRYGPIHGDGWAIEPYVDRVANGVPQRVDRLRALGNAVVPQIPELIGNAILQSLEA
jgi:DNA (cytosine-5)-methyltransferase 1